MKFSNFVNSLLTNLVPPEIKLAEISRLKFMFKRPYLSQYLTDAANKGSNIKLECLEVKNTYHTYH